MPNYRVTNCLGGTPIEFIVSATSLSIGQYISVNQSESLYCGIVFEETEFLPDSVTNEEVFLNCCECLTAATGGNYLSFAFSECGTDAPANIEISTFCSVYGGVPTILDTLRLFNLNTNEISCFQFVGPTQFPTEPSWIFSNGPYNLCQTCLNDLPLTPVSAGTEYFVCQICSDSSGATATEISVPHPVWTRPNGQEVTLLDAVQLGGMFGLNS